VSVDANSLEALDGEPFEVAVVRHLALKCPRCGYDLSGARALRCAECGCDVHLRLRLNDQSPGWYRTVLLGLCLGWPIALISVPSAFSRNTSGGVQAAALTLLAVWSITTVVWLVARGAIITREGRSTRIRTAVKWGVVLTAVLYGLSSLVIWAVKA